MLILAGITISQLTGNGILEKAKLASEETKKSQLQESIQLSVNNILYEYLSKGKDITNNILKQELEKDKEIEGININDDLTGNYKGYEYYIDENYNVYMKTKHNEEQIIKSKTIAELAKSGKIKAGDYINYCVEDGYKTDENGNYIISKELTGIEQDQTYNVKTYNKNWRVLSVDQANGKVEIFSENNILINNSVETLSLKGKAGYNNYVKILNDICMHYINTKYAISARSFGSNPLNPEGTTQKYENSSNLFIEQYANDFINQDEDYIHDLELVKQIMSEEELKEKSNEGCILLASRYLEANSTNISFKIRSYYNKNNANSKGETYSFICGINSNGDTSEKLQNWGMVIPIITLNTELKLRIINENDKHNTEDNKWIIENT